MDGDHSAKNTTVKFENPVFKNLGGSIEEVTYSKGWIEVCRKLLIKYFELRKAQTTKRYSYERLCVEIMEPHHDRDKYGKIILENESLTRQDLRAFMARGVDPKPPKFKYIDYFITTEKIWINEYFDSAREDVLLEMHIEEANFVKACFSSSTRALNWIASKQGMPSKHTFFSWSGSYWNILRGNEGEFRAKLSNFRIPTHILEHKLDSRVSYVKVLFPRFSDFPVKFWADHEKVHREKVTLNVQYLLNNSVVLHGYLLREDLRKEMIQSDLDPSETNILITGGNLILYSRILGACHNNPILTRDPSVFPKVSFSTFNGMISEPKSSAQTEAELMEVVYDANRHSLNPGDGTGSAINPFPRLGYGSREMSFFNDFTTAKYVKKIRDRRSGRDHEFYKDYFFKYSEDKEIYQYLMKVEDLGLLC